MASNIRGGMPWLNHVSEIKMLALCRICSCAALALVACPAFAQALSLEEAQRSAVERSHQLKAQNSVISATREMAVAAGQLPDPALRLGVENLPVDGPDRFNLNRDFMTMRRIGVMQEFTRGEKRQLRAERFDRESERALAEKAATLAMIQRDTALAWLERYYAEALAGVVAAQVGEARLEIEAVDAAYRAGRGNQADALAARLALAALEDRLSESERRIRTAKTALNRWVGEAAAAPLGGKPDIDAIRLDPRALEAELSDHPQIAVLSRQSDLAASEAKLARANRNADWSVEVAYSQRGSAYSNMLSFGVSIPLQWDQARRQDRELAAKLALADEAKDRREEALRAHVGEVRAQIQEWESLRERRTRYERVIVPLAKDRTRSALSAYRGAKAGLADVLAARRNEIDVQMQALQLESENARLWAQLSFLSPDPGVMPHVKGSR